jgi:hypothetical protein
MAPVLLLLIAMSACHCWTKGRAGVRRSRGLARRTSSEILASDFSICGIEVQAAGEIGSAFVPISGAVH